MPAIYLLACLSVSQGFHGDLFKSYIDSSTGEPYDYKVIVNRTIVNSGRPSAPVQEVSNLSACFHCFLALGGSVALLRAPARCRTCGR